jgi:hypothetical protein
MTSLARWSTVAWQTLSEVERRELGCALRDRFFELSVIHDDPVFRAIVDGIDDEPIVRDEGLGLSFHPTARHKQVRFVELEKLPAWIRSLFASPEAPHLAAVFVDPTELSFHTFENIVPLDRVLGPMELALHDRRPLGEGSSFTVQADDATRAALARLDELGLYVSPLNASSRGGVRFIFHSAALGDALTRAVKQAMPELDRFSHVNPVFRCNRFEPGDGKFSRHVDAPYFDRSRGHLSEFTLLLYLTGGTGSPALALGDAAIDEIAPWTCIVFPQAMPHEGCAYNDGRKVFLRSELVFEEYNIDDAPVIGKLFAKACYLTSESVFAPELARHADALYDRVATAHWQGLVAPATEPEPLFHKEFRGQHWITNGYDFWFPRNAISLEECALLAIFDYLNCTIGTAGFRSLCQSSAVTLDAIDGLLAPHDRRPNAPLTEPLDHETLFPEPESTIRGNWCCPDHTPEFDPTRFVHIVEHYRDAQWSAQSELAGGPIYLLGQELFLDRTQFVVEGGKIHVLSTIAAQMHFAACRYVSNNLERYIGEATRVTKLEPLLPPILFTQGGRHHHLMLDLFRNSWVKSCERRVIPIPRIRNDPDDD